VALRGMLAQGSGSIFNMEGLGSDGRRISGLALYGTTEYGLDYFNRALIEEARDTPVIVGTLSAGMVVTDMTTVRYAQGSDEGRRFRRVMNLMGDRVENVAAWLAHQMLVNEPPSFPRDRLRREVYREPPPEWSEGCAVWRVPCKRTP
jgi:short-subunit dehydrogenase